MGLTSFFEAGARAPDGWFDAPLPAGKCGCRTVRLGLPTVPGREQVDPNHPHPGVPGARVAGSGP